MRIIQDIGLVLVGVSLCVFTAMLFIGSYTIDLSSIDYDSDYHKEVILGIDHPAIRSQGLLESKKELHEILAKAQKISTESYDSSQHPEEWNYKIGNWKIEQYQASLLKNGYTGVVKDRPWMFFFLTFGLAVLGGLLYIIPLFGWSSVKHWVGVRTASATRGLAIGRQGILTIFFLIATLIAGAFIGGGTILTLGGSAIIACIIVWLVYRSLPERSLLRKGGISGTIALIIGIYMIGFYVLLYWFPDTCIPWTTMVNPLSSVLNGGEASRWFLYGLMYTLVVIVMGIRMLAKYKHNRYQKYRTLSVMFFQTAFAFLIPEILVRLNYPYYDFKNIWPLNYSFFFDYNLNSLLSSGSLGIFMLVWGLVLMIIGVPVLTYFYGKRWYCSWVCGCGGLAETLGDPYRQLSDKSLKAWKYERYIIHGVLVFAVVMTITVLYTYFSSQYSLLGVSTDSVKQWYGFFIGSAFSGVVGTGFYPLMGNRVWCRFGCPLAAYLGLVQRFKSRFRITVNGGQCISCGNCSTYCEMGIDVRAYAQRGQHIVRSSCVGCGVCASVCPRGVLRLENVSETSDRTAINPIIHIKEADVRILS